MKPYGNCYSIYGIHKTYNPSFMEDDLAMLPQECLLAVYLLLLNFLSCVFDFLPKH